MTIFLKLGGSLLTDKTRPETVREQVVDRLAREIAAAWQAKPRIGLVLGHGSGSFGHLPAAEHGTRDGVETAGQWGGFTAVSDAAARLNRRVVAALMKAGVPAVALSPSASARCEDGRLVHLATRPIQAALTAGLVPVVYGDVAFDAVRGGTIISTEEVLTYLTAHFHPTHLFLAGETDGVYGADGRVLPRITPHNLAAVDAALGGSRGTDVTGGMAGKVRGMVDLAAAHDGLSIRIFSGLTPGLVGTAVGHPASLTAGTEITAE